MVKVVTICYNLGQMAPKTLKSPRWCHQVEHEGILPMGANPQRNYSKHKSKSWGIKEIEKEFLKIIMERNGTEGVEDSLYKAQSLGRRKNWQLKSFSYSK